MERTDVVKALECCLESACCEECPSVGFCNGQDWLVENALALVRELTEEKEKWESAYEMEYMRVEHLNARLETERADTVKKMQEAVLDMFPSDKDYTTISRGTVKRIAKEVLGENK